MTTIIYITNVRLPTYRAHGLQIMKMCEAFTQAGAKVRLIVPALKPSVSEEPFSYYCIRTRFPLYRVPVLEVVPLERWLGRWLGYVQNASFTISALLYAFFHRWFRDGVVYTRDYATAFWTTILGLCPVFELHDYRSIRPRWRIGFILRKSRLVVVNSEGTAQALRKHYQILDERLLIAPNGVDPSFFAIPQSQQDIRSVLGIPSQARVIAYIGRLETVGLEKGIPTLLKAFAEVQRTHAAAFLLIVGGPDDLLSRYRSQARELGIPVTAAAFIGQVPYAKVPQYLRAADITVIPLPEGQHATTTSPIKLFEYMAAGKTILASDLPSLKQYLNVENAAFFKPADIGDFAYQLNSLLEHPDHACALGAAALRDAQQYTWRSRAQLILHDPSL